MAPPRPDLLPAGLAGLDGAHVRSIARDGLEAWVSTFIGDVTASPARARAHNDVCDAALNTGRTPLPARFGQRFADDDACLLDVAGRGDSIRAALRRVDGAVEMGVILAHAAPREIPEPPAMIDPGEPGAGRAYLQRLRQRELAGRRIAEAARHQLDAISVAVADMVLAEERSPGQEKVAATVAFLVPRGSVSRFRSSVDTAQRVGSYRLVVTGPRAPYTFSHPEGIDGGTILAT